MRTLLLFLLFVSCSFVLPVHGQTTPAKQTAPSKKESAASQGKGKSFVHKLSAKALVSLTDSDNVGVRCSAFLALVKMDNNKVRPIFLNHIEDDEELSMALLWGLVSEHERVNQFMLAQLHPDTSESSYKFTRQEYEACRKFIYKQTP